MPLIVTKPFKFIQQIIQGNQQAKLIASDTQTDDEFGISVSISGDGNTAIVGAHQGVMQVLHIFSCGMVFDRVKHIWHEGLE